MYRLVVSLITFGSLYVVNVNNFKESYRFCDWYTCSFILVIKHFVLSLRTKHFFKYFVYLWLFQDFKAPEKPFLRMNYTDAITYLKEHEICKDDGSFYEFGEVSCKQLITFIREYIIAARAEMRLL